MFGKLFNDSKDLEAEDSVVHAMIEPESELWQVCDIIKKKDRREFNKFIDGTKSLYEAWLKYQPTVSKDEKLEQEILAAESELEAQGEAEE